jgi:hypothetical protein
MEQLQTISLKSVYPMVKDGGISAVFNVQLFRLFQSVQSVQYVQSVQFVQKRSGVFNMPSTGTTETSCLSRLHETAV